MLSPYIPPQRFFSASDYGKFKHTKVESAVYLTHPASDPVKIPTQPAFLHLLHLLQVFLPIFPSALDWTDADPRHQGKAFQVERRVSTKPQDGGCLVCLSNTNEVYVGGMEGMRGQLVGDEIRHIVEQTDIKDTLCR